MEILITIIGLIIALLTFWYSFYRKPKEELDHLKVQFNATQQLSKEVQRELENYINNTKSREQLMYPNITFGSYLIEMRESYKENLSDDLYNKLNNLKLTKPIIKSMTESLETQFKALQQIQIELKIRNRQNIGFEK